jgi:hypothetical protein
MLAGLSIVLGLLVIAWATLPYGLVILAGLGLLLWWS